MIFDQRLGHCLIEYQGLIVPQKRAHRKHMRQRGLLKFAHRHVRGIDRGFDRWTSAMLCLDSLGKPSIVRAHLRFECLALNGKIAFKHFQLPLLIGVEFQSLVQDGMDVQAHLWLGRRKGAACEHTKQRRCKRE